jgi:hypothetical protein
MVDVRKTLGFSIISNSKENILSNHLILLQLVQQFLEKALFPVQMGEF